MNRKDFIQRCLLLGISTPVISLLSSSFASRKLIASDRLLKTKDKIIIVGAGASGLIAGYLLKKHGVDFQIIEAAPVYGGRLKKSADFADFPIDLGAEWIHTNPKILREISQNPNLDIEIMDYNPKKIQTWKKNRLKSINFISYFYGEWKFQNSTWFDYFEKYIISEISDHILLNQPISLINHHSDQISLQTANQKVYNADKILLTTSIKTLQQRQIDFQPALPGEKLEAINRVLMGDGVKIFVAFREKFYPDMLAFGNAFQALREEEKFVYDAAFKKKTKQNILGLFAINEKAKFYTDLKSEDRIIKAFLDELDEIFDGKASANYLKHVIQNWSDEPYIQGSYSYTFDGKQKDIVAAIKQPIDSKIYFAGEALSIADQATVHGACATAYEAVAAILGQ